MNKYYLVNMSMGKHWNESKYFLNAKEAYQYYKSQRDSAYGWTRVYLKSSPTSRSVEHNERPEHVTGDDPIDRYLRINGCYEV